MQQHWSATLDHIKIEKMPFYWRLRDKATTDLDVSPTLPIRASLDSRFEYIKLEPKEDEWENILRAYQKNENIGFLNPESGQMSTYGSSVNTFFLQAIDRFQPKAIYEIGCGAGFSIKFLADNGWAVTGIDPSDYSRRWSEQLGFNLHNDFFHEGMLPAPASFIYCNDVFEHVRDIEDFCSLVFENLADGGVFCFATTNSDRSIEIGDISMFEHQHVNMFSDRSIYLILEHAGFSQVEVLAGSYGNTYHVTAIKSQDGSALDNMPKDAKCDGFFKRAKTCIEVFETYYNQGHDLHCYVPLRCTPYLSTVGDYGKTPTYDSNTSWHGKYMDGYTSPIMGMSDITSIDSIENVRFFIGSLTFIDPIKTSLLERGVRKSNITSILDLLSKN